jgi:protein O-mannosyl-transferase
MNPKRKKTSIKKNQGIVKKAIPDFIILGTILIFTFLLYSNSFRNELLHFDDTEYFSRQGDITQLSWHSIMHYFSDYYLLMYQPLPILTFALQYYYSALQPFPLHFVNLCFHLVNILLVFQFISLLFRNKNSALLIAFVFAIHPMNVEAVSWISARSSGMYMMFYLSSLIFYIKYISGKYKVRDFILSLLFLFLSLLSKSQAVTLPFILLLIDFISNRKIISRRVILEKVPFIMLSAVFAWITISNPDLNTIMKKGMFMVYTPLDDFFLICYSVAFYLVKFFIPLNLCAAYVFPPKTGAMMGWQYYISPLLLVVSGIFMFRQRRNKMILFGAVLFLITISLNIQIIPSRLVITADRYGYFPYLGLLIILASYLQQKYTLNPLFFQRYKTVLLGLVFIYVVFFSVSLYNRNKIWNNDYVFMSDMIAKNPEVQYLYRAYGTRGNYLKRHNRTDDAFQDFTKAIQLKPDNSSAYANRAGINMDRQDYRAAINDADSAIKFHFQSPAIFKIRAAAKYFLNDWEGALDDCDRCLKMDPSDNEMTDLHMALLDSLHKYPDRIK